MYGGLPIAILLVILAVVSYMAYYLSTTSADNFSDMSKEKDIAKIKKALLFFCLWGLVN